MTDVADAVSQAIDDSLTSDIAQPGSLAAIADAAYDKAVAEEGKDDKGTTVEEAEGTSTEPAGEETGEDEETTEDESEDTEEGYYADEGQDEVEEPKLETTTGNPTDMGQWVLEQLPKIYVIGTSKGEQVSLEVKRAEDLPTDFEFLNKRDEMIFSQNISDQTTRAVNLINKWNSDQQTSSANKFSEQENRDIQLDIASLQRDKVLGKFKYQPNDSRFEKDPAVKEMQEVLDFYNEENQKRYAESQRTGRLFSRLSYRDAFYLHQRQTDQGKSSTTTPPPSREDNSRKAATKVLARGAKGQGDAGTTTRPRLARNATVDDIITAYGLD